MNQRQPTRGILWYGLTLQGIFLSKVRHLQRCMTKGRTNPLRNFPFNISSVDIMENLVISQHEIEIPRFIITSFFHFTRDNRNDPLIETVQVKT